MYQEARRDVDVPGGSVYTVSVSSHYRSVGWEHEMCRHDRRAVAKNTYL